ncbi:MAG: hypothetical protein PHQ66_02290 [Candidatus Nanoarchaeia archaeon]|nr:hypothetical protein [Candidatus Nanoarchaeia archaeon]MDD5357801.1 hypothetical protein [Candidatus Nanoarchaeia archaeon]MDD5588720.1 hypothetical protein [Candidatus Nanoarchaeia archaeon]
MVRFWDNTRDKSERILREVVKGVSFKEREKMLDDYATKLLQLDNYDRNWNAVGKYFKDIQEPKLENSVLDNFEKIKKIEQPQIIFGLITALHSDLPNQPLLS